MKKKLNKAKFPSRKKELIRLLIKRKKQKEIRTIDESSDATNSWIQHLVIRTIVNQLNLPHRLQDKLRTLSKIRGGNLAGLVLQGNI